MQGSFKNLVFKKNRKYLRRKYRIQVKNQKNRKYLKNAQIWKEGKKKKKKKKSQYIIRSEI